MPIVDLHRYLKMFINLVLLVWLFEVALLQSESSRELIHFEPLQYIKSQIFSANESTIWSQLVEASPQEIGEISSLVKEKLHNAFRGSETNYLLVKGNRIISKRLSKNTNIDGMRKVPYANLISLLSVSMTIVLEGFQSKLINRPIGEILKGDDLSNPIIKGYELLSLLEIMSMVTSNHKDQTTIDSEIIIKNLNKNGEVALYFVNSVLGGAKKEAWMDALMAFTIENYLEDSGQMKLSLNNIFQFALTVIHDFHVMEKATVMNLPFQDHRYLLGWWLNCPISGNCIFPDLPQDLIFSVSSTLRIYISPSFELFLIISDVNSEVKSFQDLVMIDRNIWKQISLAINQNVAATTTVSDSETADISDRESEPAGVSRELAYYIHQGWPVFGFIFWVSSSYIWVYWMFHFCWYISTFVSKRTHIPRPQTSTDNN